MLFQELIQQHRVDSLVADGIGLAVAIASHQVGIYFRHLLRDQAKSRDALWI